MGKYCKYCGYVVTYLDCMDCDEKYCKQINTTQNIKQQERALNMADYDFSIGIDESYTNTGITVLRANNEVVGIYNIDYKGCKNNTDKREYLKCEIESILQLHHIVKPRVTIERIRLISQGVLSQSYICSTGALISTIIDLFRGKGIPVYSVDTRAWKNAIIGTTKPKENKYSINPNKYPTLLYLRKLGLINHIAYIYKGRGKKGVIHLNRTLASQLRNADELLDYFPQSQTLIPCKLDDDRADSYCIARYGNLPLSKQKRIEETF